MKKDLVPPKQLKERGKQFWLAVIKEFTELEGAHDLERLTIAANCLDEIEEAEELLKHAGLLVQDRWGGWKEHPAVKIIKNSQIIFLRAVRELGLDLSITEPRPPRQY